MRRGRAESQRSHHDSQSQTPAASEPRGHHLHAHGIHAGQRDPGEKPQHESTAQAVAEHRHARIQHGTRHRCGSHHQVWRHTVSEVEHGRRDGARHESQLDGCGEQALARAGEPPLARERPTDRRGREPHRHRQHLHQRDVPQLATGDHRPTLSHAGWPRPTASSPGRGLASGTRGC
jgi:hypothetical protein